MSLEVPSGEDGEDRAERRLEMARALARGGMEGVQVLTLEQANSVLTPKRQEIIEALSHGQYDSVRGLARELDRDKGDVSRDLGVLSENAIVSFDTDGRSKSPRLTQKHIVVEPIV